MIIIKSVTSFFEFCLAHRADGDDLGDLASEVAADHGAPRTDEVLRAYLLSQLEDRDLVRRLWKAYLREKATRAVKSSPVRAV